MNPQKIAIVCDSGCDVPKKAQEEFGIYVLPLKINFKKKTFTDGLDIEPQELYTMMETEIPKTSLPDGQTIVDTFEQIKRDGYESVMAITISSGLSGTYNLVRLLAEDEEDLDIRVLDTRNISIGSGFHVIQAARYAREGYPLDEIYEKCQANLNRSKVFYVVATLEYLQKGGRIGLVTGVVGNVLHLKPIISCNEEGIYYNAATVRGRKNSVQRMIQLAQEEMAKYTKYDLAVMQTEFPKEIDDVKKQVLSSAKYVNELFTGQISATLGVHVGPKLIGIGVFSPIE